MSSKKFKIPSSARRHIKYETFSSFVSASRLRQVQNILLGHDNKIDGILCIAGIDSRYNEGMSELLHYLLFGFFDVRKQELESSGFSEEVIDDLMIFIKRDRVEIYCNPINYHYLLPMSAIGHVYSFIACQKQVPVKCNPVLNGPQHYEKSSEDIHINIHVCLQFEEDDDYSEEFKIYSLIAMVSGCTCVGIPFSGKDQNIKFDIMAIEKWPIIQAFALDDFGGGGFFTLKHEVVDISRDIHKLPDHTDPVSVEIFLTEHLPLLQKQWDTMAKCVDLSLSSSAAFLSQRKVSEPFSSYFNHGLVGHKRWQGQPPFVAFSKDTEATKMKDILRGNPVNFSDIALNKTTELEHMVCRIVSPQSPLICTRTYFFCQHYGNLQDGQGGGDSIPAADHFHVRYAVTIYLSMVQAVLSAIDIYSETASIEQAKKAVLSTLENGTEELQARQLKTYFKISSNIEFKIEIPDLQTSARQLGEGETSPRVKHASLILYGVPAAHADRNGTIGSLAFSETFLDSRILYEGSSRVSSDVLVLTSTIPRIHVWSVPAPGSTKSKSSSKSTYDIWGELLVTHDDIDVLPVWKALLPPVKMSLAAWERGLTVKNNSFGGFSLHSSHIKSIALYDGDSMAQVSLLIVEIENSQEALASIPPHFCIPENMEHGLPMKILFAFNPHSKGHTKLYGKILPTWKEDQHIPPVERLEFLDYPLEEIHDYLQLKFKMASKASTAINGHSLKKTTGLIPNLNSFLDHLTCSSRVSGMPVKPDVFNTYTGCAFSNEEEYNDKIVVTIIGGAPGSEKNSLSTLITTYNSHVINWLVYKQPEECSVNTTFLHRSMLAAVQSKNEWKDAKRTRVILVAPGFCDTSDVIRAIFSHPDPKVSSHFRIGAVTICIDPLNTFMENKVTLPMLTSQCAQGWVNNIIFTSQTQKPSDVLDDIQGLIRSINPDVALLKAEKGDVKRSMDLDLIMSDTAFDETDKTKARVLIKPFWQTGPPYSWPCHPAMKDVVLKFTHPLEKHLLLIKLRGIRSGHQGYPFDGNIYFVRGFLAFTSSSNIMEVQFSPLSDKLVLNESRSSQETKSIYIMSFTGIGLKENALKEILRACVKQKPEKKKFLRKEDISKHEIDRLHSQHRHDELPEGWFYNGTLFVSMAGERSRSHPNIDVIVDAYLAKKNADIKRFNDSIDTETYVNLFP